MSDELLYDSLPSRPSRAAAGSTVRPRAHAGSARLLLLLIALLARPFVVAAPAEDADDAEREKQRHRLADLVVDLGHEIWSRREAAQNVLLRRSDQATVLLRAALDSDNLERACRARYLLDKLDPLLGLFQIVKIRLGNSPQVTDVGTTSGSAREELSIAPRDPGQPAGGNNKRGDFRYTLFFTPRDDGEIEILVNRTLGGYPSGDSMNTPLTDRAAISLLVRTEECHYRELGVHLERERGRFLTLLRVRYGRSSELSGAGPSDPDGLLRMLLRELRTQAGSGSPPARAAAIEILSYLAPGKADGAFRAALDEPALRPIAILGLDRPRDLGEIVESGASGPGTTAGLPPPGIRAAARLLQRGDATYLPFLIDRLTQDNPEHLHYIMATIADFVDAHAPAGHASGESAPPHGIAEETRQLLVRRIFSEAFFSHAVWQNQETAYFVDRIGSLVDSGSPEEAALVEQSLARLEGMVQGGSGPIRISLDVGRPIWRRLAARLASPPSERAMLFRLLPSLLQGVSISQASYVIDETLAEGPLSDVELSTLLDALVEAQVANTRTASALLVGTLGSLQLKKGQLRAVVTATLRIAETLAESEAEMPFSTRTSSTRTSSPRSTSARSVVTRTGRLFPRVAERLRHFTGVSLPAGSRDLGPWTSWLNDEEKVREHEEKLLSLQEKVGGSGPSLLLFEFDLVVDPAARSAAGRSLPSSFELADGRVLPIRVGEVFSYRDRWGNAVHRRVSERPRILRGSIRSPLPGRSPSAAPETLYRFDDSHMQYALGVPTLGSIVGRELRSTYVETSPLYLGSRILSGRASSSYRTVVLLTEPGVERPPVGSGLSALWDWFLETYVLTMPAEPSGLRIRALTQLLRALKIDGAGAVMSKIFDLQPSYQLARDLHDAFGDRKGIEYYRSRLPTLTGGTRLYAARLLAEFGDVVAADILMENWNAGSLTSLDRYLQLPSTPPHERARVLDFLVERMKLDSSLVELRQIFATVGREANDDFGFTTAAQTNDPREKRENIRKAIEDARAWTRRFSATTSSEDSR